jgi:hypothetical protein
MRRRCPQRREHGAVAAQRDHEIARLELSSPRDLAVRSADSRDLDDVQAVLPGPALQCLERPPDWACRMDDQGDARRLLMSDHTRTLTRGGYAMRA